MNGVNHSYAHDVNHVTGNERCLYSLPQEALVNTKLKEETK